MPLDCMCWYKIRCKALISHFMTYSTCLHGKNIKNTVEKKQNKNKNKQTLSGSWDSTSFFKRLNKNGRRILWRRRMISMDSSGLISIWEEYQCFKIQIIEKATFCKTFSPVIAKGALNHCSKLLQHLKIDGSKKFSNAHSSGSLFLENSEGYKLQYYGKYFSSSTCNGVPVKRSRCGAV